MLNKIMVKDGELIVKPGLLDKLLCFKMEIKVPLDHVVSVKNDPEILEEDKGKHKPGYSTSRHWCGTFVKDDEVSFYNIKSQDEPVVIELKDEKYKRLILGHDHPEEIVKEINDELKANKK